MREPSGFLSSLPLFSSFTQRWFEKREALVEVQWLSFDPGKPPVWRGKGVFTCKFIDAAAFAHLMDEEMGQSREFLRQAQRRGDRCAILLENGVPAAYAWLCLEQLPDGPVRNTESIAFLHTCVTAPNYRGRDLPSLILTAASRYMKSAGVKQLMAAALPSDLQSATVLSRLRFTAEETGEWYANGRDWPVLAAAASGFTDWD
jgi:GNAT superfamily N-acetyltransferase